MKKLVGYSNIDEFKADFAEFVSNQNDKVFLQSISDRVNISSPELITSIKDELLTGLMETNPKLFIQRVSKTLNPKCWMIIKSHEDPFFEV